MALNAGKIKDTSFRQDPLEPGNYPGRVVGLTDLGLQEQDDYNGKKKDPRYEFILTYELSDEFLVDKEGNILEDKPRFISEKLRLLPLTSDLATSTKRYLVLDPAKKYGGDFFKLINTPCNIMIVINKVGDKVYENIGGISPLRKKEVTNLPELINTPKVFDMDNPDKEVFDSFPSWIQDKIKSGVEYKESNLYKIINDKVEKKATQPDEEEYGEDDLDDEVPF